MSILTDLKSSNRQNRSNLNKILDSDLLGKLDSEIKKVKAFCQATFDERIEALQGERDNLIKTTVQTVESTFKKDLTTFNKKVQMVADLQRRQVQESDDKVSQLNVKIEAIVKQNLLRY